MRALVLVDLQNDFCPGGALAVERGDEVLSVALRIADEYDVVVATQDWHPADHESFATNHEGRAPGELIELHGLSQVLWPVHCVQGTPGAEFVTGFSELGVHEVFRKGGDPSVDSYSGFFDNGRRHSTGLSDYLRRRSVGTVSVMGLALDYCVKFTALDAKSEGFTTELLAAGCRAVNLKPGDDERAIDEMRSAGIAIVTR